VSVEDRADFLLALRQGDRALELLAAAERSARVQNTRGRAFLSRGDYIEAASTLAEVPLGASPYETSMLALADCSLSKGRSGAAAELLSAVPHASLDVRKKLAEIFVDEGELRAALRLFDARRASERAALAEIFERAGRFEEAAAYYASLRVSAPKDARLHARASAEQLVSRGHRRSAIAILERWASVAPEDLHARVRLIELLQAERRGEEASRRGRRALEIIDDARLRAHLRKLLQSSPTASR
jgi:thioredoxin-like negative regulator of GroEL